MRSEHCEEYAMSLEIIFGRLKDKYPLEMTNALAVDDGFVEDFPLLYGKCGEQDFWLYDCGGDYVFSYGTTGVSPRDHTHPQNISEAVDLITEFMSGQFDA